MLERGAALFVHAGPVMDKRQKLLFAGLGVFTAGAFRFALRARRRMRFDGATVLITGGSRGLGLAIATRFAREGANLVLVARDPGELKRAEAQLAPFGVEVLTVAADVRVNAGIEHAIDEARARFHRIDVLVNDAGVIQVGPLEHMRPEDFTDAMAVHFFAPLNAMRAVVPIMKEQGGGRIVNISSIGGKLPVPHLVPYDASKAALSALSSAMGVELAKHGIRVTTVHPTLMRTGSPINASFKGRYREEHAWFAIGDALPFITMSADRAAKKIVDACRYGDAEPHFSVQGRLATIFAAAFPRACASLFELVDRALPAAAPELGDDAHLGRDSASRYAPSFLTRLNDRAAQKYNEVTSGAEEVP